MTQPETAFWLLSALVQSSAALAGLSAVLLVFQLQTVSGRIADVVEEAESERGVSSATGIVSKSWAILIRTSTLATFLFVAAALLGLGTLWGVQPSAAPPFLDVAIFVTMALMFSGSFTLLYFVLTPRRWVLPYLDFAAGKITKDEMEERYGKLMGRHGRGR